MSIPHSIYNLNNTQYLLHVNYPACSLIMTCVVYIIALHVYVRIRYGLWTHAELIYQGAANQLSAWMTLGGTELLTDKTTKWTSSEINMGLNSILIGMY